MKKTKIAVAVMTLLVSSGALAHGYIESPASRAYKCKLQENMNCGSVQYEPQSVEKTSGFPEGSLPRDGELASASIPNYSLLDKQSVNAWSKNMLEAGRNTFTWHHTAPHKTANWRYYITKQDWNPNQPLTRDAFESKPFCFIDGQGKQPQTNVNHECDVPQRTGYQAIYGVWQIQDTSNSFYQVIDVDFGNDSGDREETPSLWTTKLAGQIAGKDLAQGDKVIARFFNSEGEVVAKRVEMTIDKAEQTDKNRWAHALATLINEKHDDIHAGLKDSDGNVKPVFGSNNVYSKGAAAASRTDALKSVAISYEEKAPEYTENVQISNVQATKIKEGKSTVTLKVQAQGEITVEARVINHAGVEKGYIKQIVPYGTATLSIPLQDVTSGHHMLKYYATNKQGNLIKQEVIDLTVESEKSDETGKYQYVFPQNLKSYTAGTVVLQPKNGKTYQCKPFPYSGYCVQWSSSANMFEPGTGSNWQNAWIEVAAAHH